MTRRSSRGVQTPSRPGADDAPNIRAPEFLGFSPTQGMIRVKTLFWTAIREDSRIDPKMVGPDDVAAMVDAPSIQNWWRDPNFRAWFLNKDEWRGKLEYAYNLWLDTIIDRLASGMLEDKNLANLGKLLSETSGKVPRVGDPEKTKKKLTDAEALEQFRRVALELGWTPPAALPTKEGA